MATTIVRVFVSSTWLDLQRERAAVEALLQKFRETKFVGMEHFGSRDETTRAVSLAEVERSDLYVGIIGGRYGSGITHAEYTWARERALTCLIYMKEEAAIPPEGRDGDAQSQTALSLFKSELRDQTYGHLVTSFSGPYELATRLAADLHNWLFERYFAKALGQAATGELPPEKTAALNADLRHFSDLNRELLAQLAAERQRSEQQRRLGLEAFYELTYVVPEQLSHFPNTAAKRAEIVRGNLDKLERLLQLTEGAHDVLRELATNYRLLAAIQLEQGQNDLARASYEKSAAYSASLVLLQPGEALYHRDEAVSHFNIGCILEEQGRMQEAHHAYEASIEPASIAAHMDPRWSDLERDAKSAVARTARAESRKTPSHPPRTRGRLRRKRAG